MSTKRRGKLVTVAGAIAGMIALAAWTAHSQGGILFVQGDNVGIGTSTPSIKLHVIDTTPTVDRREVLKLENNGAVQFALEDLNAAEEWKFALNNGFRINRVGTGGSEFFVQPNGTLIVGPGGTAQLLLDPSGNLTIQGNLNAVGAKNFVMPDPENPKASLYYSALEGPEAGTYLRGTARTSGGEAVIELPRHFSKTSEPEGLTVQITALGEWSRLYVAEKSLERLVVRDAEGRDIEFDYFVQGVRKGYADYAVERPAKGAPRSDSP